MGGFEQSVSNTAAGTVRKKMCTCKRLQKTSYFRLMKRISSIQVSARDTSLYN